MLRPSRRALLVAGAATLMPKVAAAGPERRAYLRAWRDATRKLVIYRGFGTALHARITWLSPAFRDALADERHRLMGEADTADETFRTRMTEHGASYTELVIGADSGEEQDPRFGNDDARWNLRLVADGTERSLAQVEHIRRPTPVHQGLYPQLNIWSELWIVRFDGGPARAISLKVGSGLGNGEVSWP